jgi:chromosome segregation ATPase
MAELALYRNETKRQLDLTEQELAFTKSNRDDIATHLNEYMQKLAEARWEVGDKKKLWIRVSRSLAEAQRDVEVLKSTLRSDEEQLKLLVDRNVALRDAAVIKHQEDEIARQVVEHDRDRLKTELTEVRLSMRDILSVVQRYQPEGSPPAGIVAHVLWVLGSLQGENDRLRTEVERLTPRGFESTYPIPKPKNVE